MSKKTFTIKASNEAKRKKKSCSSSAKKDVRFKADMVTCDEEFEKGDIVIYLDGKQVYRGSIDDSVDTFVKLCERKDVYDMLFRFCNSFGDDIEEEGASPRDVGYDTWQLVQWDYDDSSEEYSFYEDFGADYHYNDPYLECFLASELA